MGCALGERQFDEQTGREEKFPDLTNMKMANSNLYQIIQIQ
jgi:hypothetical protein